MYACGAYPPLPQNTSQSPTNRLAQSYQRALPSPEPLVTVGHNNINMPVARQTFAAGNAARFGLGVGGNPFLPANFNAGSFNLTRNANTTDRSISNAFNLDRDGIDVDLRRYRPAYYAARWERNNPGAIYPNYYPYLPYASGSYWS